MAVINTLRNKAGKIVVVVLTITMASFVLTDLFSNSSLLTGQDREIAEIEGSEIKYEDFQAKVDELTRIYTLNAGRNPQGAEVDRIRNQAWQSFLVDLAYQQEYEALGLQISEAQLVDMVQGDNIHPHVTQMMSQTGQMNKDSIRMFLRQLNQAPVEQQQSWIQFESTLPPSRQMMQLDKLMEKTNYVSSVEARHRHQEQNSSANISYVYVPYTSIADSTVTVSDDELVEYMEAHENEYQRDEARDVAYVAVSIDPSAADSSMVYEEMNELIEGLRSAQNDSSYVTINSDSENPFVTYRANNLPDALKTADGNPIPQDSVTQPTIRANNLVAYKMSRSGEGAEAYVNASHILIRWDSPSAEDKEEARSTAQEVLDQALSGEDFSRLAAEFSEDQTNARRGGDLGWFGENSPFAQPFKDAAFSHEGTGVIPEVVETQFGYHIIKINEPKTREQYKVAVIEKEFFASSETIEIAYRKASQFQAAVKDDADFEEEAAAQGFEVQAQKKVTSQAKRVGTLVNARPLVLWLYNDASVGSISDIFEIDDNYVVATMTGMQEEGLARLDDVRSDIEKEVRNAKKADQIISKLKSTDGEDFQAIAENYGSTANAGEATITLGSNSITGVGSAPEAVGLAFSLDQGEKTQPFAAKGGVLIMEMLSRNDAQPVDDYSTYSQQIARARTSRKTPVTDFPLTFFRVMISQKLDEAIKELSGLEDKRHKFF